MVAQEDIPELAERYFRECWAKEGKVGKVVVSWCGEWWRRGRPRRLRTTRQVAW